MENFNKLIPIDGENGEKRTISSLQIAEITGKAYCGVLKVIRKMDIMRVKITMKNIFSLFVCLKKCCNFAVRQFYYHIRIGENISRGFSVHIRPKADMELSQVGEILCFLYLLTFNFHYYTTVE